MNEVCVGGVNDAETRRYAPEMFTFMDRNVAF